MTRQFGLGALALALWVACSAPRAIDRQTDDEAATPTPTAPGDAPPAPSAPPPPSASAHPAPPPPPEARFAMPANVPPAEACRRTLLPPAAVTAMPVRYDRFHPTIAASCAGTHHQMVAGIEKLVFLGDSITAGTPPSAPADFYSTKLSDMLVKKFGPLEIASCAVFGATTVDLLAGGQQIAKCFPTGVEPKKTLVVMTLGSNNMQDWALAKPTVAAAMATVDVAASQLKTAFQWLKSPAHFPSGSYVVFANAYEYTDGTGDLDSCPVAPIIGLSGNLGYLFPAILYLEEQMMKVAVDTGSDLMFLYEHFCGHGYHDTDPAAPCYRGPSTDRWFDVSCLHPTPFGHTQLAGFFYDVIVP
jgi:hypothetical protein